MHSMVAIKMRGLLSHNQQLHRYIYITQSKVKDVEKSLNPKCLTQTYYIS